MKIQIEPKYFVKIKMNLKIKKKTSYNLVVSYNEHHLAENCNLLVNASQ